jgi:hypothetical protein
VNRLLCACCNAILVAAPGNDCQFCVATNLFDAGHISATELNAVMSGHDDAEALANACECQGGAGEPCDDCSDSEREDRAHHEFIHAAGRQS